MFTAIRTALFGPTPATAEPEVVDCKFVRNAEELRKNIHFKNEVEDRTLSEPAVGFCLDALSCEDIDQIAKECGARWSEMTAKHATRMVLRYTQAKLEESKRQN